MWKQCFPRVAEAEQPHIIISLCVPMALPGTTGNETFPWADLPCPSPLCFFQAHHVLGYPCWSLSHPALTLFPWQNLSMFNQNFALSHMSNSLALGREKFLTGNLKCSIRQWGWLRKNISKEHLEINFMVLGLFRNLPGNIKKSIFNNQPLASLWVFSLWNEISSVSMWAARHQE